MNYYFGQGKLYVAQRSSDGSLSSFRLLGNVSALSLTLGAGGARYADTGTFRRAGAKPTFNMQLESLYPDNLALVLAGTKSHINSGARTAQVTVARGQMTPLPDINLTAVTSVTNGGSTYPASSYSIDLGTGGVEIPANSVIPDNTKVTVSYTCNSYDVIDAYTQNTSELALRYNGVNTIDYGPIVVDIFRTKFDPVDGLDLLGDNLSSLRVTGEIMYDNLKDPNSGISNFFRIRQT